MTQSPFGRLQCDMCIYPRESKRVGNGVKTGDFVREIHFYPSDRIAGNHDKKDLVSFSYLTEEEYRSPEYSSVLIKYKILNWMKGAGIRGQSNGRDPNDPTKKKHYAIRIEHARRQVIDIPCDAGEIKEMLQVLSKGDPWNRSM